MARTPCPQSLLALVVGIAIVGTVGLVGPAGAAHGDPANFTVYPVEEDDHRPGIEDASYITFSKPPETAEFDGFKYMGYSVLEWEAGTLGKCGIADNKVAGIDRYDDDPWTDIDEDITDNIEGQPVSNEDKIVIDFDDPNTIGHQPVYMNVTDEFVSHVTNCRGNPDEPGWYQIIGTINGTTWSDEHVERTTHSHYFYICECESYDDAVATIGPPPSKATPTPGTATATSTPSGGEATPTGTTSPEGSATPTEDSVSTSTHTDPATAPPTSTPKQGGTAGPSTTATGPTPAAWARRTVEGGPGFGVGLTLLAFLGALAVGRRLGRG